jgi:hypothetical protein
MFLSSNIFLFASFMPSCVRHDLTFEFLISRELELHVHGSPTITKLLSSSLWFALCHKEEEKPSVPEPSLAMEQHYWNLASSLTATTQMYAFASTMLGKVEKLYATAAQAATMPPVLITLAGSYKWGLASLSSDIDVVLTPIHRNEMIKAKDPIKEARKMLRHFAEYAESNEFHTIGVLVSSKKPVITLHYVPSSKVVASHELKGNKVVVVDVSAGDLGADVEQEEMAYTLAKHPLSKALYLIVRDWACRHGCRGPSASGLNTHTWMIMVHDYWMRSIQFVMDTKCPLTYLVHGFFRFISDGHPCLSGVAETKVSQLKECVRQHLLSMTLDSVAEEPVCSPIRAPKLRDSASPASSISFNGTDSSSAAMESSNDSTVLSVSSFSYDHMLDMCSLIQEHHFSAIETQ